MPSSLTFIHGRLLFVEVSGTGPPLVSLHGLGGSTNLFPIAEDLSASFTVIRFDFEGAGKSPLSSSGLSVGKFVEDVKAVLSFAGFEGTPAVLFGHSLGAAISLHFAATYPELVNAVILSCPGVARPAASHALAATARENKPLNMADFTAAKNTGPTATRAEKGLIRTAMQESSAEGYAQTCEMMAEAPSPDWSKITSRVLVIAGVHDQISNVTAARTIAGCLTSAKAVRVEEVEAGHQPAVEASESVLALLATFLEL